EKGPQMNANGRECWHWTRFASRHLRPSAFICGPFSLLVASLAALGYSCDSWLSVWFSQITTLTDNPRLNRWEPADDSRRMALWAATSPRADGGVSASGRGGPSRSGRGGTGRRLRQKSKALPEREAPSAPGSRPRPL